MGIGFVLWGGKWTNKRECEAILDTAPNKINAAEIVTVWTSNSQGTSPPTSIII
jgi:hypothetical protein